MALGPIAFGDLVALAAALCWASTSLLARALAGALPPLWFNALRCAVGGLGMLLLLPWTIARADLHAVTPTALGLLVASTVLGIGIGDTAFFASIKRLGVSRAMPIAGSYPLLTALLAVSLLGEPITWALVAGMVLVGIGIWLVTGAAEGNGVDAARGDHIAAVGLLLAAVAAVGWAGSAIAVRPALESVDVLLATTIRLPIAAALLVLFGRARRAQRHALKLGRPTIGWTGLAGLLTVASTTLFLWAVALVGSARTAALTSASPLFAAPLAVLLLGERLTRRLALGIAVTVAGVALIVAG